MHFCESLYISKKSRHEIRPAGAVSWFSLDSKFDTKDSICSHFGQLPESSAMMKPFCLFALNFFKNLFSTACVEARFLTVSLLVKSTSLEVGRV